MATMGRSTPKSTLLGPKDPTGRWLRTSWYVLHTPTYSIGHISDTVPLAFSAFTDLVLAIFPFFVLRGLQMDLKLKISLIVLLGLGVLWVVEAHSKRGSDLS